nr:uncharacterized protein LOC108081816 [Drosophila kikkawai]
MKTLMYIQLTAAIFAVVLFDTTTQVTLLLNVLRPVEDVLTGVLSSHLGKSYGIQQIQTAVDIYLKAKQVNGEISKEDAYVVGEVLRLCQQDRSLFDILSHTNRCTLTDIQEALHLIAAKLGKPAFYQVIEN